MNTNAKYPLILVCSLLVMLAACASLTGTPQPATPSAAAELVVPEKRELAGLLNQHELRCGAVAEGLLSDDPAAQQPDGAVLFRRRFLDAGFDGFLGFRSLHFDQIGIAGQRLY